ncbi:MAG: hypothetical protein PHN88_01655 [Ignavibacteria bacterium]|nr:hypothetical protein [Ignavibacteria bacterium]
MKKLSVVLLFIVSVMLVYTLKAQTADELIEKYADALGGRTNITLVQSTKTIGSISMMGLDLPFTMYTSNPDKSYLEVNIQGMLMKQGCDGKTGWTVNPMAGSTVPEKVDDETAASFKARGKTYSVLFTYKDDGAKVELIGKEPVGGKDAYKIKYTSANNDEQFYYLDADNSFLLKLDKKVSVMGKVVSSETTYSNFKKVGDVMMPFMMEVKTSESKMGSQIMTLDKVELNPAIDETVYMMPAK